MIEFDPQAPRMQLEARQVRSGDHMRDGDGGDFRYVKGTIHGGGEVVVILQDECRLTFDRDATVEVARRVRWAEVPDRYRIIDAFPYLDREEEYTDLTLEEAAAKMEDLTGIGADVILADFDENCAKCEGAGRVWLPIAWHRGATPAEQIKGECDACHGTGKRRDPWEWSDPETGREVTLRLEVEPDPDRKTPLPEAGGMGRSDGLGA